MPSQFEEAIQVVLTHEGGYVNDPVDPGGETNFGITKRTYPHLDIKSLTREAASKIYLKDWWLKYHYNEIEDQAVATKIFDLAVNMGARRAHKLCQKALTKMGYFLQVDGQLGPKSISAINNAEPLELLDRIRNEARNFYLSLIEEKPQLAKYKKGWLKRADS